MNFRYLLQKVFCAAAALAAATASAGEGWRHLEPQASRAVEPEHFLLGADASLWLFGADGIRRVDAAGATTGWLPGAPILGELTSDGGAVFVESWNNCLVKRVDAAVRVRWAQPLPGYCVVAPAGDAVWVANHSGKLYRLDADGAVERELNIVTGETDLAAMPDGGVAVVARSGVPMQSTLTRYGRDGAKIWTVMRDAYLSGVVASADGTLTVGGRTDRGVAVSRFRADGTTVTEYLQTNDPASNEGDFALRLAPDGSVTLATAYYATGGVANAVYRFGTDGAFAWRVQACAPSANGFLPPQAILPLSGGGAVVACNVSDGGRFLRFDASGTRVVDVPLPALNAKLGLRSDGTLQVLGNQPGTNAARLYSIGLDGNTLDVPMPQTTEPLEFVAQQLGDDGASYVLSRSALLAEPRPLWLSKIDANGAPVWRRTFYVSAPSARLAVGGGQACVAQSRQSTSPWQVSGFPGAPPRPPEPVSIACVASGDGADRWARAYPADSAEHFFGALDDGTFVHLHSQGSTHQIVRHDSAGNEAAPVTLPGVVVSAVIATTGDIGASVYDTQTRLRSIVRYDRQGVAHPIDFSGTFQVEIIGVAAGRVMALVGTATGREYRWFGTDGALAGSYPWAYLFGPPTPDRTGEAMYLVEVMSYSPEAPMGVYLRRLNAADGTTQWFSAPFAIGPDDLLGWPDYRGNGVVLDASRDQVVVAYASSDRLQIARFDAVDGAAIGQQAEACDRYCGKVRAVAVDTNGLVRVALPITAATSTAVTAAIVKLPDTFVQPAVRIDQIGLSGAWWAPYANGEGFVADFLPDTRTWFMPWFTFSREGGGDRSAQRWYVVAGAVAAGATQAQLPILETTGGTFDNGGGTTVRQVGLATLRFTDCDNGTLRYAFDTPFNGGATGTITLSRLSAATQDCVLADGSVQPRTTPPAGGFDARMSGSWYEEATSGQGLQFTVQPGGVFFAPWFTFDPAGTADDPGRQRWYTLQGSLANASDGRVEVPIVETTGGAFDSVPANRMATVGTATVVMQACDRATLAYAFDATAGDLANRTGTIALVKAGGCTP